MSWADVFTETDDMAIMDLLGDECTYNGATIHAVIEHTLQEVSMVDAYTTASTISIRILKSDVPKIKRGSKIIFNDKTIVVDAIIADSGSLLTMACRYA